MAFAPAPAHEHEARAKRAAGRLPSGVTERAKSTPCPGGDGCLCGSKRGCCSGEARSVGRVPECRALDNTCAEDECPKVGTGITARWHCCGLSGGNGCDDGPGAAGTFKEAPLVLGNCSRLALNDGHGPGAARLSEEPAR